MRTEHLETLLRAVYESVRGSDDDQKTQDFIFHMRDWEADLLRAAAIYTEPSRYSQQECKEAVDGLLLHACGHIMQAARLYGGIIDTFGETDSGRT